MAPEPAPKAENAADFVLPDSVWRGVCYAHSWEWMGRNGYGSAASAEALDHLQHIGVDWVSITPFGFMTDIHDTEVRGEHSSGGPPGAETRERIAAVAEQAHQRGMKVMLKPHIWIRGGAWRGHIKPLDDHGELDWKDWWDSHDQWILYYARLAEDLHLSALVIGLELHTAVKAHPERLIALADKVRKIYHGHVTYSANWNEPVPADVWRAMDSVGVQFYPPLAKNRGTFVESEVRQKLRKYLDQWSEVATRADRPLVITEVGYRSADIAVSNPNAWPEKHEAVADDERQARAYEVFFEELRRTPRLQGVFLWKYFTNSDTDEEGPSGFSPLGKPAERIIRSAYAGGSIDRASIAPHPN